MVFSERRGAVLTLDTSELLAFAERLNGEIILPEDGRYDEERMIFNAAIDRRPAAIVRVADAQDVVETLAFARKHDLPVSVRGGGHGTTGASMIDDGLVIDLSLRKFVEIDVEKRTARAGAGLRAGEFLAQVEPTGLVGLIGDASHTGLSGMSLGGGYGWLSGKHGMVIDNLLAVEIVTADCQVLRASKDENPDLFWAVRGGSGNFGVVTTLEYKLHPLTQVLGGMMVFPFPMAREVLQTYRDVTANAPDELTTYAAVATMPDGMPVAVVMVCYSGDIEDGEKVIAPFRALGPVADMVSPMPYSGMTALTDPMAPLGFAFEDQWANINDLTDEAIEQIISLALPERSLGGAIVIKQLNGAARRVSSTAMAFPHRDLPYSVVAIAHWAPGVDGSSHVAWVQDVIDAVEPLVGGFYVNGALDNPAKLAFGVNYDRLVDLKNRYDPTNMFHGNVNIEPTIG